MGVQVSGTTVSVTIENADSISWTSHLLFTGDNTYDIGASGATRPRTGYFGTSVVSPLVTNAGTLALSATGANIITLSTNGSEAGRVTSDQRLLFGTTTAASSVDNIGAKVFLSAPASNYGTAVLVRADSSGRVFKVISSDFDNGTNTGRGITISVPTGSVPAIYSLSSGNSASGSLALLPSGGNVLIGTTTDGNYKLDIASSGSSGTLRVYDQTATTGSTSLVVRAGAGQSSGALLTLNSLASGYALTQHQDNGTAKYTSGKDDLNRWYLYDHTNSRNVFLYTPSTGVYQLNAAGGEVLIAASGGKVGFFGATPVAKQTVTADAASILAALQAYGLAV